MKARMANMVADEPIKAGEAYPLKVFQRISGLQDGALREARRNGLPVRRVGIRSYVLGEDWLNFLRVHARVVQ